MRVNGTDINLDDNMSLYDFLSTNNYDITKIAVEHNTNIVPKTEYKNIMLDNNDTLEVVSFVGGG
ncbi:sulfur carrier protein ThiS [Vallitalea sediminicola]